MKAPVEYLKDFRKVYCAPELCRGCCFEEGGICNIKRFIYKYGKFIPEAQCEPEVEEEKPEFDQAMAYKNYISVLGGIKAELREINKHLKVMERRR